MKIISGNHRRKAILLQNFLIYFKINNIKEDIGIEAY